ncbi:unnamed protein product [Psylliodes chrysocephalus]|uniref:Uncharacterized protein n=1 Tax=Psylliodes chrysocephalus TaxID=3402493 RepID=A0A9P0CXD0_9CUCU|nr:unnamed protein product [Psylliodes chrysocephala]
MSSSQRSCCICGEYTVEKQRKIITDFVRQANQDTRKGKWEYSDLESARRPVPHNEEIPVPVCITLPDVSMSEVEAIEDQYRNSSESEYERIQSTSQQFSQEELNDLIRDLALSKQASELLASRLKEKNCLQPDIKITIYRTQTCSLLQSR